MIIQYLPAMLPLRPRTSTYRIQIAIVARQEPVQGVIIGGRVGGPAVVKVLYRTERVKKHQKTNKVFHAVFKGYTVLKCKKN